MLIDREMADCNHCLIGWNRVYIVDCFAVGCCSQNSKAMVGTRYKAADFVRC